MIVFLLFVLLFIIVHPVDLSPSVQVGLPSILFLQWQPSSAFSYLGLKKNQNETKKTQKFETLNDKFIHFKITYKFSLLANTLYPTLYNNDKLLRD